MCGLLSDADAFDAHVLQGCSVGFDAGEVTDSGRGVLQHPSPAKGCCHYLQPKVRLQMHLHGLGTDTHSSRIAKFSFIYAIPRSMGRGNP